MQTRPYNFDVAVVGGGPSGAAAAHSLTKAGLNVVIIKRATDDRPVAGETLPPVVNQLLTNFAINQQAMQAVATPSYGNQSAWGSDELAAYSHIFHAYGNGWHVDRVQFDKLLIEAVARTGATIWEGKQVVACSFSENSWQLKLKRKHATETINVRAVIDATGRKASLARDLGARKIVVDHLVGIATQYPAANKQSGYTLIEAVENGWWYSVPLPNNRLTVVFMTDADLCRFDKYNSPQKWQQLLACTKQIGCQLNDNCTSTDPSIFSASSHRLQRSDWSSPWLACGDAAISVDPISGSGVTRALQTGQIAGEAIACWLAGSKSAAIAYETKLDHEFETYLIEREKYYLLENRWADSTFWKRRHFRVTIKSMNSF